MQETGVGGEAAGEVLEPRPPQLVVRQVEVEERGIVLEGVGEAHERFVSQIAVGHVECCELTIVEEGVGERGGERGTLALPDVAAAQLQRLRALIVVGNVLQHCGIEMHESATQMIIIVCSRRLGCHRSGAHTFEEDGLFGIHERRHRASASVRVCLPP